MRTYPPSGIHKKPPEGGMEGKTMTTNQIYLKSLMMEHFRKIDDIHPSLLSVVHMSIGTNGGSITHAN